MPSAWEWGRAQGQEFSVQALPALVRSAPAPAVEPRSRALSTSLKKAKAATQMRTALSDSAHSIRSARKTWSIRIALKPSNT